MKRTLMTCAALFAACCVGCSSSQKCGGCTDCKTNGSCEGACKGACATEAKMCSECKDGQMCAKCAEAKAHACPDCKDGKMCEACMAKHK